MGRIKTQQVKRIGRDMLKKNPDTFKPLFGENKQLVAQFAEFPSKKLRNLVAGFVTRVVKKARQT